MSVEDKRLVLFVSISLLLCLAWVLDLGDAIHEEYLKTQGVCIERHYIAEYGAADESTYYIDQGFRVDDSWGTWEVTRRVPCDDLGNPVPPKGWYNTDGVKWIFIAQDGR